MTDVVYVTVAATQLEVADQVALHVAHALDQPTDCARFAGIAFLEWLRVGKEQRV